MPKETKEILSFDFANLNQGIQALLSYRVALYNAEKEQMIAIPVVIPVIITVIVPEIFVVIGVLAVIAVFLGISAKFVKLDAAKQDISAEEEKFVKAKESLKEKSAPKNLDVNKEDYDKTSAEDSLADRA